MHSNIISVYIVESQMQCSFLLGLSKEKRVSNEKKRERNRFVKRKRDVQLWDIHKYHYIWQRTKNHQSIIIRAHASIYLQSSRVLVPVPASFKFSWRREMKWKKGATPWHAFPYLEIDGTAMPLLWFGIWLLDVPSYAFLYGERQRERNSSSWVKRVDDFFSMRVKQVKET